MKRKAIQISFKSVLVIFFVWITKTHAIPSEQVVSAYSKCISASWIGSAELRMKGNHDSSDTFSGIAKKLYRELLNTAIDDQESKYLQSMIDLELSKYRALRDREQLSYAIHVLESNQCNRLKLQQ